MIAKGTDSKNRRKALFFKACANGYVDVVLEFLAVGMNVNVKDNSGNTALVRAAEFGRTEVCKLLLDHGAGLEVSTGPTPLHMAAGQGHTETCMMFLDRGISTEVHNGSGWTPLKAAATKGSTETCLALLGRGAIIDSPDWPALECAANNAFVRTCLALIASGAVNRGFEPFDRFPEESRLHTLRVLQLSALEAATEFGDYAVLVKSLEAVEGLQERGLEDLESRCRKAIELAEAQGKTEGATLLRTWLASRIARHVLDEIGVENVPTSRVSRSRVAP